MAGNAFYQVFKVIATNPIPELVELPIPDDDLNQCCGDDSLTVLADVDNSSTYRNDRSSVVYWYGSAVDSVVLTLQQYNESTGAWADAATLTDDTYGTFLDFAGGDFVNNSGETFAGYLFDWRLVLDDLGPGGYRVKRLVTTTFGTSDTYYSGKFCLRAFTPILANRTVRLEYYLNSVQGVVDDPKSIKDFAGLNWYNSLRLPGFINFSKPEYKEVFNQYRDGSRKYIESGREDIFEMKLIKVPNWVEKIIRNDFNQADRRIVTDYNNNTTDYVVDLEVNLGSKYDVTPFKFQRNYVEISANYVPTYNNNNKLRY